MRVELVRAIYYYPVPHGDVLWPGYVAVQIAFDYAAEEWRQELIKMMVEHED